MVIKNLPTKKIQDQMDSQLNSIRHSKNWLGVVTHTCNHSTLGAKEGRSLEARSSRPPWTTWQNPISTKNTKISWAWWYIPVIPATWEAEARELREPGRLRLQWAEIMPLHSSLCDRVKLSLKKENKKRLKKRNDANYGIGFEILHF